MPNVRRKHQVRLALVVLAGLPACFVAACSSSSSGNGAQGTDGGDDVSTPDSSTADGSQTTAPPDASDGATTGPDTGSGSDAGNGADGSDSGNAADTGTTPDAGEAGSSPDASDSGAAPDVVDASNPPGDASDGGSQADGAQEAEAGPCNTLVNGATPIHSTFSDAGIPTFSGGAVADGTYYLTGYVIYPGYDAGFTLGPGLWQDTAVVSGGNTLEEVQAMSDTPDGGLGAESRVSNTFSVSGSNITVTPTCGGIYGATSPYTATSTTLQILIGNVVATFTKQ